MRKREPRIVCNAEDEAVRALPWAKLGESFPSPPAPEALLRSAVGRTEGLARTQHHRRMMLRLTYGLALALLLALGGGGRYLGYRWLGGKQDNLAWACSEGYMVCVQVFEPAMAKDATSDSPSLVMGQIEQAAIAWAKQNHLNAFAQYYTEPNSGIDPRSQRYLAYDPVHMTHNIPLPRLDYLGYLLAGVSLEEAQALSATLALLPGVVESKCLAYDIYRRVAAPNEICVGRKIIINGRAMQYPQDFSLAQTRVIEYYINYIRFRQSSPLYCAFRKLDMSPDAPADPLGLGDVYKVAPDVNGQLVFTTLVARWEEGRRLWHADPDYERNPNKGIVLDIPADCPEPGLMPLQALADSMQYISRLRNQSEEQRDAHNDLFRINVYATYILIPPASMLAAGKLKPSPEDSARAREVAGRMEGVLRAWRNQHPEYWDTLSHQWRLRYGTRTASATPIMLFVSCNDKSEEPMQELLAQLAAIPGIPAPAVEIRDNTTGNVVEQADPASAR